MSSLNLFESFWADIWGDAADYESVGVIYTKPEIVDLILDLAEYLPSRRRLASSRLLEPSCGDGAFLRSIVRRLIASEKEFAPLVDWSEVLLDDSIRAADISPRSVEAARLVAIEELSIAGCPTARAEELASRWIVHTDFLLADWPHRFDYVVGNPPYVRLEAVPKPVLAQYRARFTTATDRADLYVAFIEHGLTLLTKTGQLAFICANRFTKNQYGAELRRMIAGSYRVRWYINLEHTQPFETDVSAYPGIFVVDREQGQPTLSATLKELSEETLGAIRGSALNGDEVTGLVSQFKSWYRGADIWTTTDTYEARFLESISILFPLLEESAPGTRVGIGVATGADRVFVLPGRSTAIESARQLPLVLAGDIANEGVSWSGHYVINPFEESGRPVTLDDYPGLKAHFGSHIDQLSGRHVAKRGSAMWYRTIDRIWPELQLKPKLLIPDIKGSCTVGVDIGEYYPHHNVYWITSDGWDLHALKTLLRSFFVLRQVRAFSVAMRGGHLRFQAQTLRRLRLPSYGSLSADERQELSRVASSPLQNEIDQVVNAILGVRGLPII